MLKALKDLIGKLNPSQLFAIWPHIQTILTELKAIQAILSGGSSFAASGATVPAAEIAAAEKQCAEFDAAV